MEQKKKTFLSKYTSALLIISIAGVTFFVPYQKANAVGEGLASCVGRLLVEMGLSAIGTEITSAVSGNVPVIDSANLRQTTVTADKTSTLAKKETVLDTCTKGVIKEIAEQLTRSIVNWINNGFEGGPTFVTNPGAFFGDMADQTVGAFIEGAGLDFLCTPFKLDIRLGLRNRYGQNSYNRVYCTPMRIAQVQSYTSENFEDIGWDGWLDLTSHDENNAYGSWVQSNNDLNSAVSQRINTQIQELNWGNGFLSVKDANGDIQTPGSLIVGQADQVFGSNLRELELAKEFDDIIYALINQLTSQLLSTGLRN